MTAEFDWWLLIVGLVIGAGLVWLILAELPRRDIEIGEAEIPVEAAWIAALMEAENRRVDARTVESVLRQHRSYLRLPPPDEIPSAPATGTAGTAMSPSPAATPAAPARTPATEAAAPAEVSVAAAPSAPTEPPNQAQGG